MKMERVTNFYKKIERVERFLAPVCQCCSEKVVEKARDEKLLREGIFMYEEQRSEYQIPPFVNQGIIEEYSFPSGAFLYRNRGWMFVSRLSINGSSYPDIREFQERLVWCGPCSSSDLASTSAWLQKIGVNFGEDAQIKLNKYRGIDSFAVCFPILQGRRD